MVVVECNGLLGGVGGTLRACDTSIIHLLPFRYLRHLSSKYIVLIDSVDGSIQ